MAMYITIQTIVIYFFITMVLYESSNLTLKTKNIKYVSFGLIVYSVIFGLRHGVGRDCNSYIESYQSILQGIEDESHEIGFSMFMEFLAYLDANPFFFLFIVAFIQVFLIYYTFRNNLSILPFLSLTFMLGCVWLSFSNGIRQEIAFSIFIYALFQLSRGKTIQYLLLIFLASTIHTSAIVLLIIYPIYYVYSNRWLPAIKIQIFIIIIAVYIGQTPFIINSLDLITNVAIVSGYEVYLESEFVGMLANENDSIGLGFILQLILTTTLVYNSTYLDRGNKYYMFMYFLYLFGIIYKYIFISSLILQRLNYYFFGLEFIIGAFLLKNTFVCNRMRNYYLIIILYLFNFMAILFRRFDNYSAFYFIWDPLPANLIH